MKTLFTEKDFDIPGMVDILPEELSTRVPRRLKENDQVVLDLISSNKDKSLSDIQDILSTSFDWYSLEEIKGMLQHV